jgi:hypothetical protein
VEIAVNKFGIVSLVPRRDDSPRAGLPTHGAGGAEVAITSVTVLAVKPGRYDDFLKQQKDAEALLEKCGAKNLRLMVGLTAGEASGSIVTTFEADNFTAHGKVMDAFFAGGGVEIMQAISGEDSPISTWQSSTYVDVPR